MKQVIISIIVMAVCNCIHAQVGLLSSNNKNAKDTKAKDSIVYLLNSNLDNYVTSDLYINEPDMESLKYYVSDDLIEKQNDISAIKNLIDEMNKTLNTNKKLENDKNKTNNEKNELKKINDSLSKSIDSLGALLQKRKSEYASLLELDKRKDSLANNLLTANYKLMYNSFKTALDSFSTLIQRSKNKSYTNYLLARDFKNYLDSSKKFKDKNAYQTGIADVQMRFIDLYEDVKSHKSELNSIVEKLEGIPLKSIENSSFIAKDSFFKARWEILANDTLKLANKIKGDTSKLRTITDSYNNLLKEQIVDVPNEKETKTTDFGAFPQLTSIVGKREVIPQLQLYGSYNYENKSTSIEANIGLSFAPTGSADTGNIHDIFIPTASKFLISSNFAYSFWTTNHSSSTDNDSAKRLAIKLDFGFAGKNLVFDTTKTVNSINSSMLYTKAGLELGILPKRFSIYANVNTVSLLDKVTEFKTATGLNSKFFGYLDCGAKFFLDPTPQSKVDLGLYVYSNINFIINGGDVKRVTHSDDLVIPSIQIGIVKRLGRL